MREFKFTPLAEMLAPAKLAPAAVPLTRARKALIGVVIAGAVVIAAISFTGSYDAVSKLAAAKGFGWYSPVYPVGIDAGIAVCLALDLVLASFRMRYALLRPFAWFLTAATIMLNAATAWGDWLACGMHAVIPLSFVMLAEAGRHAIGLLAAIEAGRAMESPPLIRWLIAPTSTFGIWRRMRLWQIRSYEDGLALYQEAAAFRIKLRAQHGRRYRRRASAVELLALRLARIGTPVDAALAQGAAEAEAARIAEVQRVGEELRAAEVEAERIAAAEAKLRDEDEARQVAEMEKRRRLAEIARDDELAALRDRRLLTDARTETERPQRSRPRADKTIKAKQARTEDQQPGPPEGDWSPGSETGPGPVLTQVEKRALAALQKKGVRVSKRTITEQIRAAGGAIGTTRALAIAREWGPVPGGPELSIVEKKEA